MDKGAFKCFSCGAKGGDVLAFHQQLHKMSFVDACKDLGAWETL
jgi:DNA primase